MHEHPFNQSWTIKGTRVIECERCGFKHIDPIPSPRELRDFYRDRYFQEVKPVRYETVTEEHVRQRTKQFLNSKLQLSVFHKILEFIPEQPNEKRSMLDVGAGNNIFARIFQENGWRSVVVEPNAGAADYLRKFGLEVVERYVDDLALFADNTFDFVNSRFVLEHVADPIRLVSEIHRVLKPGGLFRVCVPNDFSEGQLAYREFHDNPDCPWVVRPDHINYFSFDSMNRLLEKCGLREVYRTTSFPMEFLLLGGIDFYRNEEERAKVGPFVSKFQQSFIRTGRLSLLNKLYESLAQLGMGRSVEIFAQK